ncbi:MAG: replicative DNA helicase [Clostridia bacterium]|nr:replicative DNA helicase [Clostridia bacterium]
MPFSNEAEQSVLGAMFLDKDCIPDVIDRVKEADFYIDRHKELYSAIKELYTLGKPVDLVTLEEQLKLRGTLEKIGGIKFVVDVANTVPSTESVIYYADIVKDKAVLRLLIRLSNEISNACYRGDEETDDILARAQQGIIEITQGRTTKGLVHVGRYLNEGLDKLDALSKKDSTITGIPTGFSDIDRRTAGLHSAELILIAARPGMGKTSFVLNIAQNAAVKYGKNVAVFSLEMPGIQVANRLLSAEAKISSERLKKGDLRTEDWGKIATAAEALSKAGIYIDDTSSITVAEIGARCRKLMLEKGLDMVVIDYLQLMSASGRSGGNRQQEISEISRTLKILANDLNIPVIALSQLSRSSDKEKREPVLSDLRDSGAIEQDADVVMFLYREGYYKDDAEEPNKTKCNFAKHRNGEVGYEYLTWLGEYTSFSDWSGNREQ